MAKSVLVPALVEAALVTYRDVRSDNKATNAIPYLPLPSQYTSVVIVYGALALFPDSASQLATLIGWGLVVATALNVWTPGSSVKSTVESGSITNTK